MQFMRLGEYFAVSMVSGPKHNLLQIRLSTEVQEVPVCEMLSAVGKCNQRPLDPEAVVARVLEGLTEANARLRTSHSVTHIRYVEDDTGPEDVYCHMCLKLIEHLDSGGVFSAPRHPSGA